MSGWHESLHCTITNHLTRTVRLVDSFSTCRGAGKSVVPTSFTRALSGGRRQQLPSAFERRHDDPFTARFVGAMDDYFSLWIRAVIFTGHVWRRVDPTDRAFKDSVRRKQTRFGPAPRARLRIHHGGPRLVLPPRLMTAAMRDVIPRWQLVRPHMWKLSLASQSA